MYIKYIYILLPSVISPLHLSLCMLLGCRSVYIYEVSKTRPRCVILLLGITPDQGLPHVKQSTRRIYLYVSEIKY